jgi:toxin YhaV
MLVVNGWHLLAHPLFLEQLENLTAAVEAAKASDPANYKRSSNAKVLAILRTIIFERIPQDPTSVRYRQGGTLGEKYKNWFREKFGNGRFRLFFRYDSKSKVIIYAWVNDGTTLRTYGSKTDAYAVFASMLNDGNPPADWARLFAAAAAPSCVDRLKDAHSVSAKEE